MNFQNLKLLLLNLGVFHLKYINVKRRDFIHCLYFVDKCLENWSKIKDFHYLFIDYYQLPSLSSNTRKKIGIHFILFLKDLQKQ